MPPRSHAARRPHPLETTDAPRPETTALIPTTYDEYRCRRLGCHRLLFRAHMVGAAVQIACPKCSLVQTIHG